MKQKKSNFSFSEYVQPLSLINQNKKGAKNFEKLVKKTNLAKFGKLTKQYHAKKWNPLMSVSEKEEIQYNDQLEKICENIIAKMQEVEKLEQENYDFSYVTTVNGIQLSVENINAYEFIRDYYDILYCDVIDNLVDKKFRTACGPEFLHFLENIDYQGKWSDYSSIPKKDDVIIDIGGAYGIFAIWALKLQAKIVYVFEPNEKAREIITRNRDLNGYTKEQMPIFPFAISDQNKISYILNEKNKYQSGILTEIKSDNLLYKNEGIEKIKVITFDDFFHKLEYVNRKKSNVLKQMYKPPIINFIKIHTNGNEHLVLKGATYYLNNMNDLGDFAINIRFNCNERKLCSEIIEENNGNYAITSKRKAKMHAIYDNYTL